MTVYIELDPGKRVYRIPDWMNHGAYMSEDGFLGVGRRRVIRFYQNKRTHNIDLDGIDVCWENSNSQEYFYRFPTEAEALFWWEEKFGKCPRSPYSK
jgi:hypothetical protein